MSEPLPVWVIPGVVPFYQDGYCATCERIAQHKATLSDDERQALAAVINRWPFPVGEYEGFPLGKVAPVLLDLLTRFS